MNVTILGTSYKGNHIISVLLCWLLSINIIFSNLTLVITCVRVSSLFKAEHCSSIRLCRIWFIHCSIYGDLVCLHLLAVESRAAVDMGGQIPIHPNSFYVIFVFLFSYTENLDF